MKREITQRPMEVREAFVLIPLLNELIRDGHIQIEGNSLVLAPHVCEDRRFEWTVGACRIRGGLKQ
jgi:hypothetical protein